MDETVDEGTTEERDMDPLSICFVGTYPPTHCGLATFGQSLRTAIAPSEQRRDPRARRA